MEEVASIVIEIVVGVVSTVTGMEEGVALTVIGIVEGVASIVIEMVEEDLIETRVQDEVLIEIGIVGEVVLTEKGMVEEEVLNVTQEEVVLTRDRERPGFDRERPSDRSGGGMSAGSWRSKPAEPEADDSRRRMDDRRPAAAPLRAPVKESGPLGRMPPGPDDRKRDAPPPDDRKRDAPPLDDKKRDEKRKPPQTDEERASEQPPPVAEEGEDESWQKVSRR